MAFAIVETGKLVERCIEREYLDIARVRFSRHVLEGYPDRMTSALGEAAPSGMVYQNLRIICEQSARKCVRFSQGMPPARSNFRCASLARAADSKLSRTQPFYKAAVETAFHQDERAKTDLEQYIASHPALDMLVEDANSYLA